MRRRTTSQSEIVGGSLGMEPVEARQPRLEGEGAWRIRREPERDHLTRRAREALTSEGRPADPVRHCRDARRQVERASIFLADVAVREGDVQIAERLIRLRERAHHPLRELVSVHVAALGDRAADIGEYVLRLRVVPVSRRARPQRVVVQLQVLLDDLAEDHRAEASVADREGLHPLAGGAVVPELERRRVVAVGGEAQRPSCLRGEHRQRLHESPPREGEDPGFAAHAAVYDAGVDARDERRSRSRPAIRSVRNVRTTATATSSIRFLLTSMYSPSWPGTGVPVRGIAER